MSTFADDQSECKQHASSRWTQANAAAPCSTLQYKYYAITESNMILERKHIEDLIVGLKFKTKATKYQHTKHNNERIMQLRINISLVVKTKSQSH